MGTRSRTDVVLCYMENRVDRKLLDQLRKKLEAMDVGSTAHEPGERGGGHRPTPMVESLP